MIIEEVISFSENIIDWQKLIQINVNLQATPEVWFIEDGSTMTEEEWLQYGYDK